MEKKAQNAGGEFYRSANSMPVMSSHKLLLGSLLAFSSMLCTAAEINPTDGDNQVGGPVSLSTLAAKADLVAVAQVKDTDYVYTRSFPSEGSAYFKILIAYKMNKPGADIIEVYEKGLHPNECYFENPTVLEEGRRFLVFFRREAHEPEIYRGLSEGCALEILVTENNRYALKYPVKGLNLSDKVDELAIRIDFRDSYALVSGDALVPAEREDLLSRGLIVPYHGKFKYTHGIELGTARKLISVDALKPN